MPVKAKKVGDVQKMPTLARLVDAVTEIPIRGKTMYIPRKWSEKSKLMMPGHPDRPTVREQKGPRNPEQEAEACVYRLEDGRPGIPATALKAAMVGACRLFEGLTMTEAKVKFHVLGEGPEQLVPFTGVPILREDTPRNSNGGADLRYRYGFENWAAIVRISFLPSVIDSDSIIALLDAAGRGGIGDWRPSAPKSATGIYGTFSVVTVDEEEK